MATSILHKHNSEFSERNLFLQLALGVLSASRRLDRVLAENRAIPVEPKASDPGGDANRDQALVHFVLGVIAFRDRALVALTGARSLRSPPREDRDPDADKPAPIAPRDLLR
jgi:hypothetical protein